MYVTADSMRAVANSSEKLVHAIPETISVETLLDGPSTLDVDKSVGRLIDGMVDGRIDILAIQSAAALDLLEHVSQRIGRRFGMITGLRRVVKICGDQCSVEALELLGLDADIVSDVPCSSAESAKAFSGVSFDGMSVAVVSHDELAPSLAASIELRCRSLESYRVA